CLLSFEVVSSDGGEESRDPLRGLGGWFLCVAGLQNPVGRVEDALSGSLTDCLAFGPSLDVTAAVFSAMQSDRFAAQQGHGFGVDFDHAARRLAGIGHVVLSAMEDCVGQLMDQG